jgi:hypothetical protein
MMWPYHLLELRVGNRFKPINGFGLFGFEKIGFRTSPTDRLFVKAETDKLGVGYLRSVFGFH